MSWRDYILGDTKEPPSEMIVQDYWRSQLGAHLLQQSAHNSQAFSQALRAAILTEFEEKISKPTGNSSPDALEIEYEVLYQRTLEIHAIACFYDAEAENPIDYTPLLTSRNTSSSLEHHLREMFKSVYERPTRDIRTAYYRAHLAQKNKEIAKRNGENQKWNDWCLRISDNLWWLAFAQRIGLYNPERIPALTLTSITPDDILTESNTKQRALLRQWRARWFGLKNSKYFALSCGTTMSGVLIMIAAKIGDPIFLGLTALAAPAIIYVVTRANYWLTNKPIPNLMEELSDPVAFVKNFFKKLYQNPFQRSFIFISTLTVSIVWAAFTYDTTLRLGHDLFEQPHKMFGWSMGPVFQWAALSIGGIASLVQMIRDFGNKKNKGSFLFKMPWLSLATFAIGLSGFFIEPEQFRRIGILSVTTFMTIFTAPTIYAVFGLYTEDMMKAFSGDTDEKGNKISRFHRANLDTSATNTVDLVMKSEPKEINRFQATYRSMCIMGLLIALCATFVLRNMAINLFELDINITTYDSFGASWAGGVSFMLAGLVVALSTFSVFKFIDYKNPVVNNASGEARPINKAMIYKSTFILGVAAFVGAVGIDIASEHIMANMFTKWFGATNGEARILNYVFTFCIGIAGCAAFYIGSAKDTIEKFFSPVPTKDDKGDFSDIRYKHADRTGKIWHRVNDTANIFGTEPSRKTFDITVGLNAFFNSLPALFAGLGMVIKGLFFCGCAGAASAAGNYGAGSPKPRPLPDCEEGERKIQMQTRLIRFSNLASTRAAAAHPGPPTPQ